MSHTESRTSTISFASLATAFLIAASGAAACGTTERAEPPPVESAVAESAQSAEPAPAEVEDAVDADARELEDEPLPAVVAPALEAIPPYPPEAADALDFDTLDTAALDTAALDTEALDAVLSAHLLRTWENRGLPDPESLTLQTAYVPISSRTLLAGFVAGELVDGDCLDGEILRGARVGVARMVLEPSGWTVAREVQTALEGTAAMDICAARVGHLEVGDWNRDGVADLSLIAVTTTLPGYKIVDSSRWFVVETGDPMRIVIDEDHGVYTHVNVPGCYTEAEGDIETVFDVWRHDTVTHVWNDKDPSRPYEVSLQRVSTLRHCAELMDAPHTRGPEGTCIVNRELAWSSVRRRWVPYRGFQPAGYVLLAASGQNRAALERRAESLTDLPEGMTATVMRSDDVPGLRPGLQVLLYGGCEHRADAMAARSRLPSRLGRDVLPRPVLEVPPSLSCPRL